MVGLFETRAVADINHAWNFLRAVNRWIGQQGPGKGTTVLLRFAVDLGKVAHLS